MTSTNQNPILDEDDTYANNQRCFQNTTIAQATCMSDVSFDSDNSTLHELETNPSIAQVMNCGNPFDGWSKGKLFKLLTNACQDIFDIEFWMDKEEVLIKGFAQQHLMNVETVAELRLSAINMKRGHERYQSWAEQLLSLCVDMNKLSKDWWKEAEKRNRRKTDEINEDEKRYWEHIKPNLVQKECSLSVIGDTSAGRQ
ncbi:unnamed protein product [Rotaria sp. Silwood1]|nr:unnamed protein product [Rotaria sp. Silwood1]CAF1657105.1 unnamed protein product [Rotaria sp. Silwood1]CAF3375819.1 unnamed protein product [Rotaria sp. Silwood1]CAF3825309.1 unnamed protein product [Rotaria sp. Silwood1]CAF3881699.1 unnamed protein product [Rotaria sp. Silwood1]